MISILKHAIVVIGESFSRLSVLSGGPPISLFDMLLATKRGFVEHDVPFVVYLLRWFLLFCKTCVLPFCSLYCIPPSFFGSFGLFIIGKVSSSFRRRNRNKKRREREEER
jgi:hypothetical protein